MVSILDRVGQAFPAIFSEGSPWAFRLRRKKPLRIHPRCILNRVRCSSHSSPDRRGRGVRTGFYSGIASAGEPKGATSKSIDCMLQMGISRALWLVACVRLLFACFAREKAPGRRRASRPLRTTRSPHHDVSPRGVGSLVALGPGEFHLAVPSHLYFALTRGRTACLRKRKTPALAC